VAPIIQFAPYINRLKISFQNTSSFGNIFFVVMIFAKYK